MLKIKDNVDLIKLGFEYESILKQYFKIKVDWLGRIHFLRVNEITKEIIFNNPTLMKIVSPSKNKIYKKLLKIDCSRKGGRLV